jgi:hypothetical protein
MLLVIRMAADKDQFIAAMGGPGVLVGSNGATAQDLADAMDECLKTITRHGVRVYDARLNQERFWEKVIKALDIAP